MTKEAADLRRDNKHGGTYTEAYKQQRGDGL